MKYIKVAAIALFTFGLVWVLNHPIHFSAQPIPALGPLLNPFTGFWNNAEPMLDNAMSKSIELPDMVGNVEVVVDERGVPHIFAESTVDAYFVQGYLTAKDRLFQMDISTRLGAGRLAEAIGLKGIEVDKINRRIGLVSAAEKSLVAYKKDPVSYGYLEAYTKGVNAYISQLEQRDYPVEYKIIGFDPEPWTELKSVIMTKNMAKTLNFKNEDLESTNVYTAYGQDIYDMLFPEWNPKQSPVIPSGTSWQYITDKKKAATETTPETATEVPTEAMGFFQGKQKGETIPEGLGSNNWAVAPWKTLNNQSILCNDPHLALTVPSIWYEIQIHTKEANTYGVSLPGMPGIVIGFNEQVAWGVTNVSWDVLDWYKIKWADANKTAYILDGKSIKTDVVIENIFVKGMEKPIQDTVRYTQWGPVVYEGSESPYKDMAMHWATAQVDTDQKDLMAFIGLNKAKNYTDYDTALKSFGSPAQNFVFATKGGKDIAIKVNGKLPIRGAGNGTMIMDGSSSVNAWKGFIPMDEVPQVRNPKRGFVSSANQHSTDNSYPYSYTGNFDDYRGRYLNRRLAEMDSITIEDMMALQCDPFSILAEEALPAMLAALDTTQLNAAELGARKLLQAWDFKFLADRKEPAIFDHWFTNIGENTWDDLKALEEKNKVSMRYPEKWKLVYMMEKDTNNLFWDIANTPEKETYHNVITASFKSTLVEMAAEMTNPAFNWGLQKNTTIKHIANLESFGITAPNAGGYKEALLANTTTTGPSWRMVVSLGDTIKAYGIYPGGQSGNPGSPHYTDFIDKWTNNQYNELWFMKTATDERAIKKDEAPIPIKRITFKKK